MKSTLTERYKEVPPMDPEEHWNELHQARRTEPGEMLRHAGRRLKAMHLAEVAGIAAAGFALGYLVFSRGGRRHASFRDIVGGSMLPAASKGLHRAYDSLKNGKSFERMGREMAKVRSHW
jgi:hypothetical protein